MKGVWREPIGFLSPPLGRTHYECWDCGRMLNTWVGRVVHAWVRHGVRWATNAYYEAQYRKANKARS